MDEYWIFLCVWFNLIMLVLGFVYEGVCVYLKCVVFVEGEEEVVLCVVIVFCDGGYGIFVLVGCDDVYECLLVLGVDKFEMFELYNSCNLLFVFVMVDKLYEWM